MPRNPSKGVCRGGLVGKASADEIEPLRSVAAMPPAQCCAQSATKLQRLSWPTNQLIENYERGKFCVRTFGDGRSPDWLKQVLNDRWKEVAGNISEEEGTLRSQS